MKTIEQLRRRRKIGRNELCPCASKRKYKNCCLNSGGITKLKIKQHGVPASVMQHIQKMFNERQKAEREHLQRFGRVLPVVAMRAFGQQLVGVGGNILSSTKWKHFPDFLWDYVPFTFGSDWSKSEAETAESDRHPVAQWRMAVYRHAQQLKPNEDGSVALKMNGLFMAYFSLAYDLYVIEQNNRLDADFLERLKHREHFQGARHELFAEATCLRAGFKVERENERDRKQRHAEFTAVHQATSVTLSVEAKSKRRSGILGMPGTLRTPEDVRLRLGELINDAVKKKPPHPLVIFVDTNLPARAADRFFPTDPDRPTRAVKNLLDTVNKEHGGRDPYCLLVFTNLPYHYASVDDSFTNKHFFSTGPTAESGEEGTLRMTALKAIHDAAMLHGNIPQEFPSDKT